MQQYGTSVGSLQVLSQPDPTQEVKLVMNQLGLEHGFLSRRTEPAGI